MKTLTCLPSSGDGYPPSQDEGFATSLGNSSTKTNRSANDCADRAATGHPGTNASTNDRSKGFAAPADNASGDPGRESTESLLLSVQDLQVVLGGQVVLDHVSFTLAAGQFLAVVGPNGAGKTTLLRVIAGLERRFTGQVDRTQLPSGSIGYLPQLRAFRRELPLQVADVLATRLRRGRLGASLLRPLSSSEQEAIHHALDEVGMAHLMHRPFAELSGGQQQRVLLARSLLGPVRLLLLDEPETGLDHQAQHQFYELIRRLTRQNGLACLAVSHQLVTTARYADLCLLLNREVQAIGPGQEILHRYIEAGL
ncbi:MAG: ATP-binding cassette domain-containing protein [Limnochordaceae bacterium]|nr:ATP-binding cassette domain-containing protein [Limnochordaceae bacterium]